MGAWRRLGLLGALSNVEGAGRGLDLERDASLNEDGSGDLSALDEVAQ